MAEPWRDAGTPQGSQHGCRWLWVAVGHVVHSRGAAQLLRAVRDGFGEGQRGPSGLVLPISWRGCVLSCFLFYPSAGKEKKKKVPKIQSEGNLKAQEAQRGKPGTIFRWHREAAMLELCSVTPETSPSHG